jgi:hypothetical protein
MGHKFEVGDFAEVVGLENDTHLNGRFVEIVVDGVHMEVPTSEGLLLGLWYGVLVVNDHRISGHLRPENMRPVDRRSVCLHLFGDEDYPGGV